MNDQTCDMLIAGIHSAVEVLPPDIHDMQLRHRVCTVDGVLVAGTPVRFVSVTGGLWNVQGPAGTQIFLVHPDEVQPINV